MFIGTGIPFLKAMVLFYTLTIIYENSAFFEFSPRLICLLMALCWVHSSADNLEFLSTYFLYQKETSHSTHIKLSIKTFNRRLQLLVYKFVSSPRITTVDRGHIVLFFISALAFSPVTVFSKCLFDLIESNVFPLAVLSLEKTAWKLLSQLLFIFKGISWLVAV